MKYYAHYGHKDFILCLGYRAEVIKQLFPQLQRMSLQRLRPLGWRHETGLLSDSDIHDWNITFANTGVDSNIGQRLVAAKKYLEGEEMFLANYSDGLTDLHLPSVIEQFEKHKAVAAFLSVRPNLSFHVVSSSSGGMVESIREMTKANIRINSGHFVLSKEIFNYIRPGEELVQAPFQRLIQEKRLVAYEYDGFFQAMDTFKDRQVLEDLLSSGHAPWEVWNKPENPESASERTEMTSTVGVPAGKVRHHA